MAKHEEGIPETSSVPETSDQGRVTSPSEEGERDALQTIEGGHEPSYMETVLETSKLAPWQLARLALNEDPDEIVPSIEAVTFFEGTVAREFAEAGAKESITKFRLDRAKRRTRRLH